MRKILLVVFMIISMFSFGQECTQTDIQHAYLTVSMNESMTISDAVYSLSDTTRVNFAVGNLMYKPSTDTWKLAEHQYDFIGGQRKEKSEEDLVQGKSYGTVWDTINGKYSKCENSGGKNINVNNTEYDGWIDLFPFDSAKNLHLIDTIHNFEYRTPTLLEFQYLVGGFEIAGDTIGRKDYLKLRARGRITLSADTFVNGLILLPDMPDSCSSVEECILKIMPDGVKFKSDYDGCWYYTDNIFTAAQWNVLEKQGAIFLPASGGINWKGSAYDFGIRYNRSGFYWTYNTSASLEFGGYPYKDGHGNHQNTTPSFIRNCDRRNRRAIRVVRCEQKITETPIISAQKLCTDYNWGKGLIDAVGGKIKIDTIDECTYHLKAIPKNDYKFAYFKDLGSLYFNDSITLEIDTTIQNYVYEASFVKDNAFIYKWLDDSIVIRSDTTDLLSGVNLAGWSYTLINDSVRMVDDDEQITKLDWGVWKSDVTEIINCNKYAGLPLHMIIHNSCDKLSAVIDTIIPVVVHDTMYAHAMEFPNVLHCDLQVLEDAVLYVDSDIIVSGFLDIHEGGKVVVNEGKTITAKSIILRGDGITKKWAQLLIKGNVIHNSKDPIFYDYTLNSAEYYPLSLPDTVRHNTIVSSITDATTNYTSFWYDTELRNTHHTGWVNKEDEYILGNGYIIYSPVNRWKSNPSYKQKTNIIRYPIRVDLSNEKEDKSISIIGETRDDILPSDKNWNLIGNPYICNYKVGMEDNFRYALWQDLDQIAYITYSNDGYLTYEQEELWDFVIKPFNSYFVQVSNSDDIEFRRDWLVTMGGLFAPRRNRISELHTGITLTQGNRTEHIGLLYGNYTDEYEINADLAKMFGNAQVMYAYSISKDGELAFQAVSIDSIYPIPIGYRNADATQMSFAFDNTRYTNEHLSAIWLYDAKLQKYTNLINNEYTFIPNASKEENRFYITIEFEMATNIVEAFHENKENIFDILGRKIDDARTKGVYIIYKNEKYNKVIR